MNEKIARIIKSKSERKLVCLTAYSKPISKIVDKYCDIILVGDSVATAFYGMKDTRSIKIDTMINHAKCVKQNSKRSLLVFDMPKNTYRNIREAKTNAKKIIKSVKFDAIKIESNGRNYNLIKNLVNSGFQVMGHIGYTPQFKKKFKVQGSKKQEEKKLIEDAKNIQNAGAFSIVLECITKKVAKSITKTLKIPTIGIGSSNSCDGQILVTDDLLGLSGFYPRFVKKYVNLENIIDRAIRKFKKDVKNKNFPSKKNEY
tara:strand:+ start:1850 stop:2623 length:774 start_codon:yes stop_codon:yes gene_type:complete